jgi:hypothetical protein
LYQSPHSSRRTWKGSEADWMSDEATKAGGTGGGSFGTVGAVKSCAMAE